MARVNSLYHITLNFIERQIKHSSLHQTKEMFNLSSDIFRHILLTQYGVRISPRSLFLKKSGMLFCHFIKRDHLSNICISYHITNRFSPLYIFGCLSPVVDRIQCRYYWTVKKNVLYLSIHYLHQENKVSLESLHLQGIMGISFKKLIVKINR